MDHASPTNSVSLTADQAAHLAAKEADALRLIGEIVRDFAPAAFATSLGAEDMVITDLIARAKVDIELFTLDTGRLPEETHRLIQEVRHHYGIAIHAYAPERSDVETYIAANGPNAFYYSIELRKECCRIRKVVPLGRALSGKRAWITGLRRQQSETRQKTLILELYKFDVIFDRFILKLNPMANWSREQVQAYLKENDLPVNPLIARCRERILQRMF